jgi:cob(I)alamin adenosyltransferase
MTKIYTTTGDNGETGLVSGKRISKADPRIDLYGEVDELNSRIGFAISVIVKSQNQTEIVDFLHKIQSALFDLGSNLACEMDSRKKYNLPQIKIALVQELESRIDEMDKDLPALKNFILPGGKLSASSIHLCRTSARNCERKMVGHHQETLELLPENGLVFMNRLSDYFFVLSRFLNKHEGQTEIPWKAHS